MTAGLAFKNVLRNKERSLLTLVGVVLAIGSFIALVSLAAGFTQRVDRELDSREVHIYVTTGRGSVLPTSPLSPSTGSGQLLPLDLADLFAAVPGVRRVVPVIRTSLETDRLAIPVVAMPLRDAISVFKGAQFSKNLADLEAQPIASGTPTGSKSIPTEERKALSSPLMAPQAEILVGRGVLKDVERAFTEGPLVIDEVPFKIGATMSSHGFLDYMVLAPIDALVSANPGRGIHEFWIVLDDEGTASRVKSDLIAEVDRYLKEHEMHSGYVGPRRIRVMDRKDYSSAAHDYLSYGWLLQVAISMVGVLIAITASMNTMLMSTYERLGEYATMRAIGASRRVVSLMIVYEAIFLNVTGGLLGVLFGFLATGVLDKAVALLLEIPYPLSGITPTLLLQALALSFFVGLIGSLIPIFVVNKIDLVAQLRKGM